MTLTSFSLFFIQAANLLFHKPVTNATVNSQWLKLHQKAAEAKKYCAIKKFNTSFCLLADLSTHSGKKRFFLYDFVKDTIASAGMVSHGCGFNPWNADWSKTHPSFSNRDGSHCTSLGKYRIGERGGSQWGIGIKYLLYGLEASNKNALKRTIVLHSWERVPETEIYPDGTPEGWGCPATSDGFMRILDKKLSASARPVLLWIYN